MKVKGPGANFRAGLGDQIGRGWGAEAADRLLWGRSGWWEPAVGPLGAGICAGKLSVGVVDGGEAR